MDVIQIEALREKHAKLGRLPVEHLLLYEIAAQLATIAQCLTKIKDGLWFMPADAGAEPLTRDDLIAVGEALAAARDRLLKAGLLPRT